MCSRVAPELIVIHFAASMRVDLYYFSINNNKETPAHLIVHHRDNRAPW